MSNSNTTPCDPQHPEKPLSLFSISIPIELLPPEFVVKKDVAARVLGISTETLKKYRQKKKLIEKIHYYRWNSKTIRYNIALLKDWAVNQNDPVALQRGIDNFLQGLLSNQPKQRGRKASS